PVEPRDLLDHVRLATYIRAAEGGWLDVQVVGRLHDLELERLEDPRRVLALDRSAEQGADARVAEPDGRRLRARSADVDRPGERARAAQLDQQPRRDSLRLERLLRL